ncbi:MAG: transporter substrate-binding protein, partial [Synechococcales cyanobacterium CRU_2_2]|nr:transporter substrate-binding protein [Synechococcales cyanobacterium CRU_2_2]
MAASELPLIDAALMAIDEINAAGGVLGRPLRPIVRDGASSAVVFSAQLKELIAVRQVTTFFGGWTSDVRKALIPTLEKYNALLWYPLQYEGLEASRNVFYTGICPNQQLEPALNWLLQRRGKRLFLVGSDSIFSRTINKLLRAQFTMQGGEIVQECYVPIRSADFTAELEAIRALQPQAIFSSLSGDRSPEFYRQYHRLGLSPEQTPILAIGIGEDQLASLGEAAVGHYLAWNYFQSLDTPENQAFVQRFKRRYGSARLVSAPMEAAYSQIYLWKQSVEAAGTFDVDQVRVSAYGECFPAPSGLLTLEHNHHVARHCRIGAVQPNGSVQIIYTTPEPLPPTPWLGVESANLSNGSVVIQILAEFSQTLQQKSVIEQKSTELEEIMLLFEAQILERKRAEQELRLLLSVSQAMSQAVDLNSALAAALVQISHLTQWPYGEVWFPNRAKTHLKTGDVWYLAKDLVSEEQGAGLKRFRTYSETTEFGVEEGFLGSVYTSAETQWTQKFGMYGAVGVPILSPTASDGWENSDESGTGQDMTERDATSYHMTDRDTLSRDTCDSDTVSGESDSGVPWFGRKVLAILIFLLPEEREEDQRLIELISAVATQLGTFVQQKKAEEALRHKNQQLGAALRQLKLTQTELIQSEKMAALGQLVAGVAHEINTPLGAICSSAEYISDFLAQDLEKLPDFSADCLRKNRVYLLICFIKPVVLNLICVVAIAPSST